MPVLALWGKHGVIEALFDCLADWREVATDVRGRALACGHFIPEEKPKGAARRAAALPPVDERPFVSGPYAALAPATKNMFNEGVTAHC